jgi:hypothetical protein
MNFKDNLSNPMIQKLILKAESEKRGAFLAGAAWAFEELDRRHPDWQLQTLVPTLLQELAAASTAEDNTPQTTLFKP